MLQVGIFSDTHGAIHPKLFTFFKDCDELWHAGDWGSPEAVEEIKNFKPLRSVYGNIDRTEIRSQFDEVLEFETEKLKVCMLHIGGYPGHYSLRFKKVLKARVPDIMVCGHSHILKVMRDPLNNLMHFNPGAAGNQGFHKVCTALRLQIDKGQLSGLEVLEFARHRP